MAHHLYILHCEPTTRSQIFFRHRIWPLLPPLPFTVPLAHLPSDNHPVVSVGEFLFSCLFICSFQFYTSHRSEITWFLTPSVWLTSRSTHWSAAPWPMDQAQCQLEDIGFLYRCRAALPLTRTFPLLACFAVYSEHGFHIFVLHYFQWGFGFWCYYKNCCFCETWFSSCCLCVEIQLIFVYWFVFYDFQELWHYTGVL